MNLASVRKEIGVPQLAFYAADTLDMTLWQKSLETLVSRETKAVPMGPFSIPMPMEATSDISTPTELTLWLIVNKTLQCYVVIRERTTHLIVLNAAKFAECAKTTGFAETTAKGRIHEIGPAIRACFVWSEKDGWSKMGLGEMK